MATNATFLNRVLELTNQFRAENGLGALKLNQKLGTAAQGHSKDMAVQDYFNHTGKNGSQPWDRATAAGYQWRSIGENIAAGQRTPESVVNGWKNSPGHRANMLNPGYRELGVGYFFLSNDTGAVNYRHYWTQLFGTSSTRTTTGQVQSLEAAPIEPIEPPALAGTADADRLVSDMASDQLLGYGGNDTLVGGAGKDSLNGGAGDDELTGGSGRDQFEFRSDRLFASAEFGIDTITDFARGRDKILLSQTTFGELSIDQIGFVERDAEAESSDRQLVYSREGGLFFNPNGAQAGFGTGGKFAVVDNDNNPLTTAPSLTASDFVIVG